MSDVLKEFEKIVGKDNVSTSEIDRIVYSFDASEVEGNAKAVIWVEHAWQVEKILKIANRKKIPLVLRGGGTSLAGGAVPINSIVVDISRLNRILEINKKEKYAVVEPGVLLDDLNYELKKYNLTFPVLPASHKVVTISGMISTNAAGIRAVKYGKTRDWVIEIKVLTGDGKVKTISGKEIDDFCGTEGTVGIIMQAKLRLTEPIEKTSISMFKFDEINPMIEKVIELKDKVIALEFIDKLAAEIEGLEKTNYLFAEFEGEQGDIKDEDKIKEIWRIRDGVYPSLAANGFPIIGDPVLPIEKMGIFLSELEKMGIPSFGHIGIGIIHPCFRQKDLERKEKVMRLAIELGGKLNGEHGVGLTKKEFVEKSYISKIRKLKKKYDQNNILNRGKII